MGKMGVALSDAKYTMQMSIADWGTERILTVKADGKVIGQCDPFMGGIPVNARRQQQMIQDAAERIIRAWRKKEGKA